jgi:hypothetical protein
VTSRKPGNGQVRIPYEGEMLTYVEIAARTGLSPMSVARLWYEGKPFVRTRQGPRVAEVDGEMLTARQISERTGLAVNTVRQRMATGQPLTRMGRRGPKTPLHEYEGEMLSRAEIARRCGRSENFVAYRIKHGIPWDAQVLRGRPSTDILESGVFEVSNVAGENGLYWEDDDEVRAHHRKHGGENYGELTLRQIAELWGVSHEAVRQVEERAFRKIRALAARGDSDALDMLEWMRLKTEQRSRERPGHWEQAELNAPGNFDLSTYSDIAMKFGHVEYGSQPHVQAAHAAAERRRRSKVTS